MKNIYTFLAFSIIVLLTSCSTTNAQGYDQGSPGITYQQFYDDLSPYGNWVDYPSYGYVWVPYEQGFRPYYNNGHWVYTNYGWTWVSNYNWGWAPFHYGRWLYDDAYGWMWVPGYEWAPAWVSWRSGGGCYGWAPLGPGVNFDISIGSRIPYNYWTFVPNRYINNPRINNYYVAPAKNVTIINNTTVINNTNITNNKTVYVIGPSATEVEKVTNEKVRPVKIVQTNTPGSTRVSGSTVTVYKPPVRETPQQNAQIKPSKIVTLNELKARRVNPGAVQSETPGKQIPEKPAAPVNIKTAPVKENPVAPVNTKTEPVKENPVAPVNTKTEPTVNPQKNNNTAPVNEKPNPVIEKQVPVQEPRKVIPVQKAPEPKQENNNDQKVENIQQNNTNNKPPAVINQPAKVRTMERPNRNPEAKAKPHNISPTAPVNTPPAKIRQMNPVRSQRSPAPAQGKQMNAAPVTRTPIIRNTNPEESRPGRQDIPAKERK
jgi:hypothetical protein